MRSQRLALCRAYGAKCQGNPVDLRLEHGGHSAMPLWGAPHLTFRPQHQIAQFLHLRMIHRSVVGQGEVKVGQVVCHVYSRSKRADSVQLALEFIMAEAVEGKIEKGFAA